MRTRRVAAFLGSFRRWPTTAALVAVTAALSACAPTAWERERHGVMTCGATITNDLYLVTQWDESGMLGGTLQSPSLAGSEMATDMVQLNAKAGGAMTFHSFFESSELLAAFSLREEVQEGLLLDDVLYVGDVRIEALGGQDRCEVVFNYGRPAWAEPETDSDDGFGGTDDGFGGTTEPC